MAGEDVRAELRRFKVGRSESQAKANAKAAQMSKEDTADAAALDSHRRKAAACLKAARIGGSEKALGRIEGLADANEVERGWQLVLQGAEVVMAALSADATERLAA